MAKSNAFKLAELIRVFQYNTVSDEIETDKKTRDKNKKSGDTTKTATTEFNMLVLELLVILLQCPKEVIFTQLKSC